MYVALNCRTVSVDRQTLCQRLVALIASAALRRQFGRAGRARSRLFDWAAIFDRYQQLWGQLAQIRRAAASDENLKAYLAEAPRAAPARLDPFRAFAHYPTTQITRQTRIHSPRDTAYL